MVYVADSIQDAGLDIINNADTLYLCKAHPFRHVDLTEIGVGKKDNPTLSAPTAGDTSGRKITVGSFSDGVVTEVGAEATHWALTNDVTSDLLAVGHLGATVDLTQTNFSMSAFDIELPD